MTWNICHPTCFCASGKSMHALPEPKIYAADSFNRESLGSTFDCSLKMPNHLFLGLDIRGIHLREYGALKCERSSSQRLNQANPSNPGTQIDVLDSGCTPNRLGVRMPVPGADPRPTSVATMMTPNVQTLTSQRILISKANPHRKPQNTQVTATQLSALMLTRQIKISRFSPQLIAPKQPCSPSMSSDINVYLQSHLA